MNWLKRGPNRRSDPLNVGLWAWCLIGLGLRLLNLAGRPAWSDEWATVMFSLGHGFRSVPLDQLISLETLLAPARLDGAGAAQVVQRLMDESTHPPLYFLLSHAWIQLWQQSGELIDLGVARSLSVLFGCLSIPAVYFFAKLATQKRVSQSGAIAQTAAALTAVAPFGVYLAQDARHYTRALLFSVVSIGCFLKAWESLAPNDSEPAPEPLGLMPVVIWVAANLLGLATHYFVGLLLLAQVMALGVRGLLLTSWNVSWKLLWKPWPPVVAAIGLTVLGSLPWAIFWVRIPSDRLTAWVRQDFSALAVLGPLVRVLGSLGSMVALPAVEQVQWGVAMSFAQFQGIASGVILLAIAPWLLSHIWHGLRRQWASFPTLLSALATLLLAELGWVLLATYGFQRDLTLGARYLFGLLPVVSLGVAIALQQVRHPRRVLAIVVALGLAGSCFVAADVAYRKPDQSRQLAQEILASYWQDYAQNDPQTAERTQLLPTRPNRVPIVMGAVYKTHEQVGEMMSLAYEWQRLGNALKLSEAHHEGLPDPQFILAQREPLHNLVTQVFRTE